MPFRLSPTTPKIRRIPASRSVSMIKWATFGVDIADLHLSLDWVTSFGSQESCSHVARSVRNALLVDPPLSFATIAFLEPDGPAARPGASSFEAFYASPASASRHSRW